MVTPFELTCEYEINPLGIDVDQPRLGWLLQSERRGAMQSAYQILVASSPETLQSAIGDKWDTGKVLSERSVNVPYAGEALASGERCWWMVRVWDDQDQLSAYSNPAIFEMGLMEQSDWTGIWIGGSSDISSPLLRREFSLDRPIKQVRTYISGLGWYELYLNGQRVGDHVLDPATSDYARRILYATYDVTALLHQGTNVVGVMLGNGWYCEPGAEHRRYGDSPRLLVQMSIEYADGSTASITSDANWRIAAGPITRNDFGGETYDARLEQPRWSIPGFDDTHWAPVLVKDSPRGKMVSQTMPAIKVNQIRKPIALSEPQPGVYVYDFGQLFGGWARLRLRGERGTEVTIKYSALLFEDTGLVDKRRHPEPKETDYYNMRGDPGGEEYAPRFTYHPVRYVQIEGYPGQLTIDDLQGEVIYSAVDLSGDFECSNPLFNRIHENVVWTLTNELFGIPLDCLDREHWAWTDPATVASSLYPRKHIPSFWIKWLYDIQDAQHKDGRVPDICPDYVRGGSRRGEPDPAWGGNYPILVWYLYQYYDDARILEEHYASTQLWVDYLSFIADGRLINKGHYGDHMLPGKAPMEEEFVSSETPPSLLWTGFYYRDVAIIAQMAGVIGKQDDASRYARLATEIKDALNATWLDPETHNYASGSQTANLFPLSMDIVPEAQLPGIVSNIVADIVGRWNGHLHTGNIGTTCLIDTLTEHGQGEVLYNVVNTTEYPGWGYMVANGATTIWESWTMESRAGSAESMIMWASIAEFFYNDLAGIQGPDYFGPKMMVPGFKEVRILPRVLGNLSEVAASMRTVYGMISSAWRRTAESITLEVSIPVNCRATVGVPKMGLTDVRVIEGDETVWEQGIYREGAEGVTAATECDDHVTFDVGSGSYCFTLTRRMRT